MTAWQRRARAGLALFGLALGGYVYWSAGERRLPAAQPPVERADPAAVLESTGAVLQQVRGVEVEYEIRSTQTLSYEDASARHLGVEVRVVREGRSFVVTAREALAGAGQVELTLTGDVRLRASDGFQLETAEATFDQNVGVARASGAVRFEKGRVTGSGLGATYDQRSDVLEVHQDALVTMTDAAGRVIFDGAAATATLDRLRDRLVLSGAVRVLRGTQVMTSDRVEARLSPDEEFVTYTQLQGHAGVEGGEIGVASMAADDIELFYGADGVALERVVLTRQANVRLGDTDSAMSVAADAMDLTLAPDGAVQTLSGRDNVDLQLPAADGAPARRVRAFFMEAVGQPGRGESTVRFERNVEFGEGAGGARLGEARELLLTLRDAAVAEARFFGNTRFTDEGLRAASPVATYRPGVGRLDLGTTGTERAPSLETEGMHIEARSIAVDLDRHAITAEGDVSASLTASSTSHPSGREERGLPGFLERGKPVHVSASRLDYDPEASVASYAGAVLWQGETMLRGELVRLDRAIGDVLVRGGARSTMVMGGEPAEGRADEIRYDEAGRVVVYSAEVLGPRTGSGKGTLTGNAAARLSGPQGDLEAERIEVGLARAENQVERLDAYREVRLDRGARTAAGDRLTYAAEGERYVVSGSTTPATVRLIGADCRETTGRTLTFYGSDDRIFVDGNEARRTETRPCAPGTR